MTETAWKDMPSCENLTKLGEQLKSDGNPLGEKLIDFAKAWDRELIEVSQIMYEFAYEQGWVEGRPWWVFWGGAAKRPLEVQFSGETLEKIRRALA